MSHSGAKLLIGLSFEGSDQTPSGAGRLGRAEYLELLRAHRPEVAWNEDAQDHVVVYNDAAGQEHRVVYPTLMSLAARVRLAGRLGAGVAIWRLGQGLPIFWDLL